MLWAVTSVKLVCEVALMAALGRAVLGRLLGPQAEGNPFHRLLGWVVNPLARPLGRALVPALVLIWCLATAGKLALCLGGGCR